MLWQLHHQYIFTFLMFQAVDVIWWDFFLQCTHGICIWLSFIYSFILSLAYSYSYNLFLLLVSRWAPVTHESAKLNALCAQVPTCLVWLHANVPCVLTRLVCLCAHMPMCLVCLRAHVPICLACLCANVSCVLTCSCASHALHAYVLMWYNKN